MAPLMAFQRTVLGRTRRGRLEKGTLGGHRATARRGCRAAVGGRTVAGAGPAPRVGLGSARRGSAARLLHLAALHSCAGQTGVLGCDARKASGAALSPSRRDPGSRRRPERPGRPTQDRRGASFPPSRLLAGQSRRRPCSYRPMGNAPPGGGRAADGRYPMGSAVRDGSFCREEAAALRGFTCGGGGAEVRRAGRWLQRDVE